MRRPLDLAVGDRQPDVPLDLAEDARRDRDVERRVVAVLARVARLDARRGRGAHRLLVGGGQLLRGRLGLRVGGEELPHLAVVALLPRLAEVARGALGLGVGEGTGQQPAREGDRRENRERSRAAPQAYCPAHLRV